MPDSVDGTVEFFDLAARQDGEEVIVGRTDTGDFVALPALGWHIIESLRDGATMGTLQREMDEAGVAADVTDFVADLSGLGFVRALGGAIVEGAPATRRPSLPWMRAEHVRFLFTPVTAILAVGVVLAGVTTLVVVPRTRPTFRDLLFSSSTTLVLLATTLLFLAVVALHELSHLVSARAAGVAARISLGTRLYSLVAQTDVSGLWAATRFERMRTYLAGMATDFVLASALVVARASGLPQMIDALVAAAVVLLLLGIAGQFQLFMRTDVYFVVAELVRARNLFEDATVLALHAVRRLTGRATGPHPLAGLQDRERRVVTRYAVVMVAGTVLALTVFAFLLLPAVILLLVQGFERLSRGLATGNGLLVWDGALTLLVEGGTQILVLVLMLRSRSGWVRSIRARFDNPTTETEHE